MKTNKEYILREIIGECVLVPTGTAAQKVNGMIHLSDTGVFIWKLYDQKENLEEIVQAVVEEFEVEEEIARRDVFGFTIPLYREEMVLDVPELKDIVFEEE